MKTICLEEPGRLSLMAAEPPQLESEQVLVRVHRIGVCGTDIHAFNGNQPFFSYPRVLGHELGVEVVDVGASVTTIKAGDRCAVEPYFNCQKCAACRSGKPNCCVHLQVLGVHIDGGMCELLTVPARKLHCSQHLSFDQLALVEPLGIGAHAVARAGVEPSEWVLVSGAGPIGLAVMQFALTAGAQVIALDINQQRLDFCRHQLGLSHTINANQENPLERLHEMTNGDLPSTVFDATGNPQSMSRSFDYPVHGGSVVFVGLFQGAVTFDDPNFHRRELTLLSSRNALPEDFLRIIGLIETGQIDTAPWITHRVAFDQVPCEFPSWTKPENGVVKAMIEL